MVLLLPAVGGCTAGRGAAVDFAGAGVRFGAACGDGYSHCAPFLHLESPATRLPWIHVAFLGDLRVHRSFHGERLGRSASDSVVGASCWCIERWLRPTGVLFACMKIGCLFVLWIFFYDVVSWV